MIRIFRTAFRIALSDNLKSKIKNRKLVGLSVIAVMLLVLGAIAEAQQPKKVARICYLGNAVSGRQAIYIKMFRERLRELGYVEGQNITIEYRDFEGKVERLPDLAAELVRLNCDVIVTQGNEAAEAAKNATKTIPVVMAFGADAVKLWDRRGPGAPRWKHHRANLYRFRDIRQTAGTFERNGSQARARGFSLERPIPTR